MDLEKDLLGYSPKIGDTAHMVEDGENIVIEVFEITFTTVTARRIDDHKKQYGMVRPVWSDLYRKSNKLK